MFWGYGDSVSHDKTAGRFAGAYQAVSGYNEPDHYKEGDSAGQWTPYMSVDNHLLYTHWQAIVNGFRSVSPKGLILSPAMADAGNGSLGTASVGSYSECLGRQQSPGDHLDNCLGWLKAFKHYAMQLTCGSTNCWDEIDVIQFHAYFYE